MQSRLLTYLIEYLIGGVEVQSSRFSILILLRRKNIGDVPVIMVSEV